MLGFATVDLSIQDNTLTVWLTSVAGPTDAGAHECRHLQPGRRHDTSPGAGMICDRYVVLTDRTPRKHPLLIGWGVEPCDLAMLAKQITAAQATIVAAFGEYRTKPGKADLIEPVLPPVPAPFDQAALEAGTPQQLTLALANQVMRTWTAWLTTEGERVKRWTYMPGGWKGETPALLPAEFMQHNTVQPIRLLPL